MQGRSSARKSGGCRSTRGTIATSTATPLTSKISAAVAPPEASSARSFSSASSTMSPGRTSISPGWRGRARTRRRCQRAPPLSAFGSSTNSLRSTTKKNRARALTEIGFYHLLTPLERALPKLLERARAQGHRAIVRAGSPERVENLSAALWTYEEAAFLPHGSARDGHADLQPIWLTDAEENPNSASILVVV